MKRGRTEEEITLDNLPDLTAVSQPDAVIPLPPGVVAEETPVFNSQAAPFVPKSRPKIIKRKVTTTDESDPIAFIVSKRDRTKNYGERKIKRVHRDTTRVENVIVDYILKQRRNNLYEKQNIIKNSRI